MMKHHETRFGYKRISSSADGQRGQTGFIFDYNLVKKKESILIQIKGYHLTKLERDVVFYLFFKVSICYGQLKGKQMTI